MPDTPSYLADERLEGMDEIRSAIDPRMSPRTFRRRWRKRIDCILFEYEFYWRRDPPIRYFTYRRLLYAVMLKYRKI